MDGSHVGAMYGSDLARVHGEGFTFVAEAAAREVMMRMASHGRRAWKARAPWRIVDLGCGSGELLAGLPRRVDKFGVDVSAAMLRHAHAAVPDARLAQGSATQVAIPPCDVVTAVGEVFSFAAAQEGRDALVHTWKRIHAALSPGGWLLFDVASPGRAPLPRVSETEGHGWRVRARSEERGDVMQRHIETWVDTPGGTRRTVETHRVALLPEAWIVETLEEIGFEVDPIGAYDDVALQPGWDAYAARRA